MAGNTPRIYVWDIIVRLCHIIFIVGVINAFVTYQLGLMDWHMVNGYVVLGALAVRIVWGFVGTPYARFRQFLSGPRRALVYVLNWKNEPVPTGHNPLGGYAVLALLAFLSVQAVTGLFADDEIMTTGPLNDTVSGETAKWLTNVHEYNFYWFLLPVIGMHILAALVYLLVKRTNLIKPMITGYKAD